MSKWQTKDFSSPIMDADVQKRTVKAAIAVFGNVDLDGDIIVPEAVTKTIKEQGPMGKKLIWHLVDHNPSLKSALGKPKELYVEGNELIAVTDIVETELGEDYLKMAEADLINQFSIGFSTIKDEIKNDIRTIKELRLYEFSSVLWGANPMTRMVGMKSELKADPETLVKRLDKLQVAFKHGNFTDETFSFIEIEIKQIQAQILELSTPPAVQAVEPPKENEALLKALAQFNTQLKNF